MKSGKSGVIVITCYVNALGVIRSLGKRKIPIVAVDSIPSAGLHSKYCRPIICPNPRTAPNAFVNFLIYLAEEKGCSGYILIPTHDEELIAISKNKEKLEKYFKVPFPNWDVIRKIINKSETYQVAKSAGVPIPETFIPKNLEEVKEITKKVTYPCLLKPSSKSFDLARRYSIKVVRVRSSQELLKEYRRLTHEGFSPLIQEEVSGEPLNLVCLKTVLNKNSEPLAIFIDRKIRQCPPDFGTATLAESVWEPEVARLGIKLLKKLKFYGAASVEFKRDEKDGKFKLMEINGRISMNNSQATASGIDLPFILYQFANGEKLKKVSVNKCYFECGVRWLHLKGDISLVIMSMKKGDGSFIGWLKSLPYYRTTFAIFSIRDLRPFFRYWLGMFAKYLKKRASRILS